MRIMNTMKLGQRPVRVLLWTSMCILATSCSGGFLAPSTPEKTPHTFTIILYDYAALFGHESEDLSQSGTVVHPAVEPLDVWADDELVGVNWQQRTLEYDTSVRDRYDGETGAYIPDGPFVIEWDGQIIVEGWLILSISPSIWDQPVLVYDPFALCNDHRVVVSLHPNHYGDDRAPIAGLSPDLDAQLRDYFSDRPDVCSVGQ